MDFQNDTIHAITFSTPHGCMGEGAWYEARIQRCGAMDYHGKANVERMGKCRGAVNIYEFDDLAALMTSTDFLRLSEDDQCVSTAGEFEITVETDSERMTISRDALTVRPPIVSAVVRLIGLMIERAKWGRDAYEDAVATFPAKLDGSYYKRPSAKGRSSSEGYF
jgi:hypothetical protein